MTWISVKDKYPESGQKVEIKIWDNENYCECAVEAIFTDAEDYRSWEIDGKYFEGRELIRKPTHWRKIDDNC